MSAIQNIANLSRRYWTLFDYDLAKTYFAIPRKAPLDAERHLKAAVQWICRAQDAFDDGGVARSYSMVYHPFFKRKGWVPSYPETTGYIIPTFFDYAGRFGAEEIRARAVRMADWECDVQMINGAVQGGTIDEPPTPAIFNTGQVIFGWVRAYLETKDQRCLDSAVKAGNFLAGQQDEDGAWRKSLSEYATNRSDTYVYNTRTAWALMYLHSVTNEVRFKEASIRNIEFALTRQMENGWFKDNCLYNPAQPLLHTIAYSIRGILEVGDFLKNPKYIEAARKAADALITKQRGDGSLAGRFDERWAPAVDWSCLTGDAQTSIIWARLHQMTGESRYLESLKKINAYLKRVQLIDPKNPNLHGGMTGSFPIGGNYGKFEILNWAVKFFIDALTLEMSIEEKRRQ